MTFTAAFKNSTLARVLTCPKCHGALSFGELVAKCQVCTNEVRVQDDVVVASELTNKSYFDDVYQVMKVGNQAPGTWDTFYLRQIEAVSRAFKPGDVVLDIGCGPQLPYEKNGAFVVGVDASFESIRANKLVDLRIFASAAELPIADASANFVVCFYSVHHMVGTTVSENRKIVSRVFREFARVLNATGRLMIFDMSPWWPLSGAEELVWDFARKSLGSGLDMYFWKDRDLKELGQEMLPGAKFGIERFGGAPFQTFPPIFSKPGLRFPRFLYPFDINLYTWQRGAL